MQCLKKRSVNNRRDLKKYNVDFIFVFNYYSHCRFIKDDLHVKSTYSHNVQQSSQEKLM